MYFSDNHSPKKQSHCQSKSYKKLDSGKQDIVKKLLYVFTFYSGKVSKYCYREMQQKYFMELMSDVWCIAGKQREFERNSLNWRNIQNVYYSIGRKNILDINQFLEILPTISLYFEPQLEREQSMKAILYFLNAIHDSVIIRQLKEHRLIEQNQALQQDTRQFILKLVPDLSKLYKIYFPEQLNNKFKEKDYFYKSFQAYLDIMKEFEVYPKLVSASQLFFVFHQNISNPSPLLNESEYSKQIVQEMGQIFRFSKFIQSFIPVSRLSLWKLKQINENQVKLWYQMQKETLKTLFEYMETVKSLKKKKSKYGETRFSLIIYEEYPQEHNVRKFIINQKKIEEPQNKLGFYDLMSKMNF